VEISGQQNFAGLTNLLPENSYITSIHSSEILQQSYPENYR